jgi:glycosyltransferase involved in cell wall biosynthesis
MIQDITNKSNLILSICIPTYNRVGLLKESINAIVEQKSTFNRNNIEIVISDNASTDGTKEYLSELIKENSDLSITYFRQAENLGPDANILNTVRLALGKFVYIVSDDDILVSGAISKLISLINEYPNYDAFCLNFKTFDLDPFKVGKPILSLSNDLSIKTKDEALIFYSSWITFLSVISFRREAINTEFYREKIGTSLLQSYIFIDLISKENGVFVNSEVFLAIRANNTGGYSFFQVFISNFYELMLHAERIGYSKIAVRKVLSNHALKFLSGFMYSFRFGRVQGFKMNYRDGISKIFSVYGSSLPLMLSAMPAILIIIFPKFLVEFLVETYKVVKILALKISRNPA